MIKVVETIYGSILVRTKLEITKYVYHIKQEEILEVSGYNEDFTEIYHNKGFSFKDELFSVIAADESVIFNLQLKDIETFIPQDHSKITRVEVIDENGRSYVNWKEENRIELYIQDQGRTLKIFINKKNN